jgi:hypothetical protein
MLPVNWPRPRRAPIDAVTAVTNEHESLIFIPLSTSKPVRNLDRAQAA